MLQTIPSEISKAQDRLTDLLQNLYMDFPQYREIVRMIMATVGRGGEGDVGQRIRDEILVIQVTFFIIINHHSSKPQMIKSTLIILFAFFLFFRGRIIARAE